MFFEQNGSEHCGGCNYFKWFTKDMIIERRCVIVEIEERGLWHYKD